jgi:uncharacterized protein (TIGR02246 family)
MRTWTSMIVTAALVIGTTTVITAADDAKTGADEQALRAACKLYVDAMNSGNLDAVVALWADDADYVTEAGDRIEGRAALKKMFNEHLQTMKGKKLAFEIKSIRMIAPGVALEDGIATESSDDADATVSGTRYSAIWKRNGDKWLISSVRDLGGTATGENRASPLKALQWLLGDWQFESPEIEVKLNCSMVLNNSFLKQTYDVKPKNGDAFTVITMIGWDPTKGEIHSWYFDSKGGFGDGYWTRNGNVIEIASTGAIADGRLGTATNVWKYIDENNLVWLSKNRQLEGVPMPDNEVQFTRAGKGAVKVNIEFTDPSTQPK